MTVPDALTEPELSAFWDEVRLRLERNSFDWRGRMTIPPMPATARLTLDAVTGRKLKSQISLGELEAGLVRLGAGSGLPDVLNALGHPVSPERAEQRARRLQSEAARDAARTAVDSWPEAWAVDWISSTIRAGLLANLDDTQARQLVASVRTVLDALAEPRRDPISRVDLAARHLGSSHALDSGSRLERAVTRALSLAAETDDHRDLWEQAGAHTDLVSGPALTWNLRLAPDHALTAAVASSTALGAPFLFTQLALRRCPIRVAAGEIVVAVENPRVVEYAAQTGADATLICTNGNPSGAVRMLIDQLLGAGAIVRYHGDFDAAGLAICSRMLALGLMPWRMHSADYLTALDDADRDEVELPVDDQKSPATPWDPSLAATFDRHRRIVHEERLLQTILAV